MALQFSFTKYEHEVLPDFRKKLNLAESTEDVINFFVHTTLELFESIFADKNGDFCRPHSTDLLAAIRHAGIGQLKAERPVGGGTRLGLNDIIKSLHLHAQGS